MSRYRGPRLRIIHRLGELPGFSTKKPSFSNKNHRKLHKRKFKDSQYSIRLKEKQKLRYNYGITERQLRNYIQKARKKKGATGEILLQFLEMRLDCIIYRLGLAPTISAARQYITHGHFILNNKKINIPSYNCKINDTISVIEKSKNFIQNTLTFFKNSSYLQFNSEKLEARILDIIPREFVKLQINELLVIEYYSRKL
jgi:small subunit ribosomal protein S4|uniref:ribosomal protein S4 n=1 Tax=Prototheca lentecrescens TaxID=2836214 RepID=UPI003001D27D